MNDEVKQLWVAALRSGKYEQTHNRLRVNDKYCCLGVLCEVAIKQGLDLDRVQSSTDSATWLYDGYDGYLPPKVLDWAGLPDRNPEVEIKVGDNYRTSLADANDNLEYDFNQIADLIEANL